MGNEHQRHRLYEEVKRVFGDECADELIESLPPIGWMGLATKADVLDLASKSDLAALRGELHGEMAAFGAEIRGELAAFRTEILGEMTAFRTEILGEMTAFRTEIRGGINMFHTEIRTDMEMFHAASSGEMRAFRSEIRGEVKTEIVNGLDKMRVWMMATMLTMTGVFSAIVFAIARLGG